MATRTAPTNTQYENCDCCAGYIEPGDGVPHSKEDGTWACKSCGGDPAARLNRTEAQTRRRFGWAFCMFIDARVPRIAEKLSEEQRKTFLAWPYEKKARMVEKMILKGAMI